MYAPTNAGAMPAVAMLAALLTVGAAPDLTGHR